jgi:DNA polymerase-3 subunit delta'
MAAAVPVEGWEPWLADYRAWLQRLGQGVTAGRAAADGVFTLYGLIARFSSMMGKACALEGARRKESLSVDLEEEELAAVEAEVSVGLRLRMFAGIERATRAHAIDRLKAGEAGALRLLTASVDSLERSAGLLRVNLAEGAALEDFLLASLRIWTGR